MNIKPASVIQLLHATSSGVFATHSAHIPGYPFATILPFVPDERHRPIFLVSALAEHTRNLNADPRASFLLAATEEQGVLQAPRLTLIGNVVRYDPSAHMIERYIRYQPDAQRYLQLGDFTFFRLMPLCARYIAGFAQMGWLEAQDWEGIEQLSLEEEADCLEFAHISLPSGIRALGIDRYGIDLEQNNKRMRYSFPDAPAECKGIKHCVKRILTAL